MAVENATGAIFICTKPAPQPSSEAAVVKRLNNKLFNIWNSFRSYQWEEKNNNTDSDFRTVLVLQEQNLTKQLKEQE